MPVSNPLTAEIAATTARIVVEEGLEWGPAKRRAVREMGLPARTRAGQAECRHRQVAGPA